MAVGWRAALRAAALAAAVLVAGSFLWPSALGGPATYLRIRGASMAPTLHQGDLVVLRAAGRYGVGDVVAYRSDSLGGTIVLHRVVADDGDRLTLQGDANSFLDPDRPTSDEVLGRLWVRVPGAGTALRWAAPAAGVLAAVLLLRRWSATTSSITSSTTSSTTSATADRDQGDPVLRHRLDQLAAPAWPAIARAAAAVTAAALVLGVVAFGTAATRTTTDAVPYTHRGTFAYGAPAETGPVYDGAVRTGDPVYLRLVPTVDVAFDYALDAAAVGAEPTGTVAVHAEVSDATGWSHRLTLTPATAFEGSAVHADAVLDPHAVHALLAEVAEATGVPRRTATVTVVPEVRVSAPLDGGAAVQDDVFAPHLAFELDATTLRLRDHVRTAGGDGAPVVGVDERRTATTAVDAPARLGLAGVAMPVGAARALALAVGLPALAVAVAAGAIAARRREGATGAPDPGPRGTAGATPLRRVTNAPVAVATMADLVRLAEHHGSQVVHVRTGRGHEFRTEAGAFLYRYLQADPAAEGAPDRVA